MQPCGAVALRWELLPFRRGDVGLILVAAYIEGDEPLVSIMDMASVLDERITKFVGTTP